MTKSVASSSDSDSEASEPICSSGSCSGRIVEGFGREGIGVEREDEAAEVEAEAAAEAAAALLAATALSTGAGGGVGMTSIEEEEGSIEGACLSFFLGGGAVLLVDVVAGLRLVALVVGIFDQFDRAGPESKSFKFFFSLSPKKSHNLLPFSPSSL